MRSLVCEVSAFSHHYPIWRRVVCFLVGPPHAVFGWQSKGSACHRMVVARVFGCRTGCDMDWADYDDGHLFGVGFQVRMAEYLAQCLNLEHELRHRVSELCILGFETLE